MQIPKVTKLSGLTNLGVYERINVVDHLSQDQGHEREINDDEAPEMKNKVVFTYNKLTSQLSI